MDLSPQTLSYWKAFLATAARDPDTRLYEAFHFDDNAPSANKLAALVLQGAKRATSSLLWEYEADGERRPRAGDLSIVTDWEASPLCVIETVNVEVRAFGIVDGEFAAAEGEGDLSLAYWREVHWALFRTCVQNLRTREVSRDACRM